MGAIAYSISHNRDGRAGQGIDTPQRDPRSQAESVVADCRNSDGASDLTLAYRQLAELNLHFLNLFARDAVFPDFVQTQMRSLSADAKRSMSQCPFPLFLLPLQDAVLPCNEHVNPAPLSGLQEINAQTQWVASVVFFAWHLAQTHVLALRYLLGVDDRTANTLRRLSIADLQRVAERVIGRVSVRWVHHKFFWPNLMRFARAKDRTRLQMALLLGRQLFATEALRSGAEQAISQYASVLPPLSAKSDSIRTRSLQLQPRFTSLTARPAPSVAMSQGA